MTKTERRNRVRAIARAAAKHCYRGRTKTQIQTRRVTHILSTPPTSTDDLFADGDDLVNTLTMREALSAGWLPQEGECIHVEVFTSTGEFAELDDVLVGWIGTDEYGPVIQRRRWDGEVLTDEIVPV